MNSQSEYAAIVDIELKRYDNPVIVAVNSDAERLIGQNRSACVGQDAYQIHLFKYLLRQFVHELKAPHSQKKFFLEMPIPFKYNRFNVTHMSMRQRSNSLYIVEILFFRHSLSHPPIPSCSDALFMKSVFNHSLFGQLIFNRQGIYFVNPGASDVLGYPVNDIRAWTHEQLVAVLAREHVESVNDYINDVMMLDKPNISFECSIISQHNEEKWLKCFACKIIYKHRPACLIEFCDITQERQNGRTQLRRAMEHDAVLMERQRISRILHDSAAQNLSLALMRLAMLTPRLEQSEEYELVIEVYQLVMSCAKQLRDLSHELDSDESDSENFLDALQQTLAQFNRSASPNFSFINRCGSALHLPSNMRIAVSNCLGELFANICRHSNANNAIVIMETFDSQLKITVKDDGRGFDCHSQSDFGFGLKHINKRILALNGRFTIESAKNIGTKAEIVLNL